MKQIILTSMFMVCAAMAAATQPAFISHHSASQRHEAPRRAQDIAGLMHIGYLGDYAPVYAYDGLQVDKSTDVTIAVKLQESLLKPYVGAKITKLRFGWSNPDYSNDAHWTLRTSREGDPLSEGEVTLKMSYDDSYDDQGWNVVDLAEPVEITAEMTELWLGYTVALRANKPSIPTQVYGTYYENTQYIIRPGDSEWLDISMDYGPLYLEALVLDERTDVVPSATINRFMNLPMQEAGKPSLADMWLTNTGAKAITSVKVKTEAPDDVVENEYAIPTPLNPGASKTVSLPLVVNKTGHHKLSLTALNGMEMETPPSVEFDIMAVPQDIAAKHQRTQLVEYFASETDFNSQRYRDELIDEGLKGFEEHTILIEHHSGDKYSLNSGHEYDDATQMLLDLANGVKENVYTSVQGVDRTWVTGVAGSMVPFSPIQYALYPWAAEELYNITTTLPTFASLNVEPSIDGRNYSITVTGQMDPGVLSEAENGQATLTVYLVESGIKSTTQELPDDYWTDDNYPSGEVVHNDVVRACLTQLYGDPVSEGQISKTFTGTTPDNLVPANTSVVAVLSRVATNDIWNRNIINAAKAPLMPTAINEIANTTDARLAAAGGAITCSDGSQVEVFDLQGRRVANHDLAPGLYVARTSKTAAKVVVK